jgi:hypothetical protein
MKITRHYCPYSTEELFQVVPGPEKGTLSINRVKGEDYFIEVYDKEGRVIISCNYPDTTHTKTLELGYYNDDEYMVRFSKGDGVGVSIYVVSRESE